VLGQFNADTNVDVATANARGDTVGVLRSAGPAAFIAGLNFLAHTTPDAIAAGDVDRDGYADVVVGNQGSQDVCCCSATGGPASGHREIFPVGDDQWTWSGGFSATAGWTWLWQMKGLETVSVLINNPLVVPSFLPTRQVDAGGKLGRLRVADLTGDGLADVAVSHPESNRLSLLRAIGAGSFAPPEPIGLDGSPTAVATADVTGDGVIDLVAGIAGSDGVDVVPDSGRWFGGPIYSDQPEAPTDLAAADFDEDDVLDLVTVTPSPHGSHSARRGTGSSRR